MVEVQEVTEAFKARWSRALTSQELQQLADNPYEIFEPVEFMEGKQRDLQEELNTMLWDLGDCQRRMTGYRQAWLTLAEEVVALEDKIKAYHKTLDEFIGYWSEPADSPMDYVKRQIILDVLHTLKVALDKRETQS
jgi:hypothetical protein